MRPASGMGYRTNGEIIADCAELGYLRNEWRTLDCTYGEGAFWTQWRPDGLVWHDRKLDGVDFTALPYDDGEFDAVVYDPPYKLNGTPSEGDDRYGVGEPATVQQRLELIAAGFDEAARVFNRTGFLLVKCMDQVAWGRKVWQTLLITNRATAAHDLLLIDRVELERTRPQPGWRRKQHFPALGSTLLIFGTDEARQRKAKLLREGER